MKKQWIFCLCLLSMATTTLFAQTQQAATDLPNISVIGNFEAAYSDSDKTFDVKELEFSFQNYLYPTVKADVFAALHKEDSGERNFELEEAYVTFLDPVRLWFPNADTNLGLGALIGKKKLGIGKVNPLHPEQWKFVDRPIAVQQFLGGDEGLAAEGAQLSHLLPVPFFSQVELGYWTAAPHDEHEDEETEETEEDHGVEFEDSLITARLWNSFAVSDSKELEWGISYLLANASAESSDDQADVIGTDLTFTQEFYSGKQLQLQAEYYQANYGEEGEEKETQTGGYLSGWLKLNPYYQTGIRFGTLGTHGDEGDTQSQWSFLITRQLTETSKFRLQYNTGENIESTLYAQFIFGMGPHAHVLQ